MTQVFPTTLAEWRQKRHWFEMCPQCGHHLDHHKLKKGNGECFGWNQSRRMTRNGRLIAVGRAKKCECLGPHIKPFA